MSGRVELARLEAIVDGAGVCEDLEEAMPSGGRPRQLAVRTLLVGILAAAADDRPAHLTRVHEALVGLPEAEQARLGVVVEGPRGSHALTYRQVERTFSSMASALGDGEDALASLCDRLVEASIPPEHAQATDAYALDWTDVEAWSRPPSPDAPAADADAAWGHRSANGAGVNKMFFGYYAQAATMVRPDGGDAVPELVRRVCLHGADTDPPPAMVEVLRRMVDAGVGVGEVLADSGYAHRVAERWATPLRDLGIGLVQDLHPHDRGPKGTHGGAIASNGNLWCPTTPPALLDIAPLARGATPETIEAHDRLCAEADHYKLRRLSADDERGRHRVVCPATAGRLRCPLKASSMGADFSHPEVLSPPEHPSRCCTQATITVGSEVNAKTRQRHDYPSPAHRRSYARRTAVERSFSTLKDTASTSVRRGWCRLMGRVKNLVMLTMATVVRNLRVMAAWARRETRAPGQRGRRSPATT